MTMARNPSWCVVCLSLLVACSEGVSEASSITYARVLAVRVQTETDDAVATPRIDEAASAHVLVAGPDGPVAVRYAMQLCVATPDNGALPSCAGPTLVATAPDAASDAPLLSWPSLDEAQLDGARELLVAGTICERGAPALDVERPWQCVDPDFRGVAFAARARLAEANEGLNHHPQLDAATWTFDGDPWSDDACSARVAGDGKEHTLAIALNDAQREELDGQTETLQLSWHTNAGELAQHFSVLEADDAEDTALEVTWNAPDLRDDNVTAATITLVVRDGRGGVTWTTRTICIDE